MVLDSHKRGNVPTLFLETNKINDVRSLSSGDFTLSHLCHHSVLTIKPSCGDCTQPHLCHHSVQREDTQILRIPARHSVVETGPTVAGWGGSQKNRFSLSLWTYINKESLFIIFHQLATADRPLYHPYTAMMWGEIHFVTSDKVRSAIS